ncbi:cutinase family protein [Mycobacterium sp. MS1601]|uniref:cutinase family protein n=1 Tax=Mycobacterium sp. MS1601 TaxID=1936029 RepID=UPI0009796A3C|nr:cutinase family protein [Mycobacterium sp. MS1601]AQA03264.1 cutinase family protein [Mycobacterium sp. MS1601]
MSLRNTLGLFCATVAAGALIGAPVASAEPACPDAEVIFARGTGEAPGVGGIGQAFVDSVRNQADGRSVDVYPVNYPASGNFNDRLDIVRSVTAGVRDQGARIEYMAATCPDTRLILGGYSQGGAVTGFTTSTAAPAGVPAELVPPPLPSDVADNVAAVVLFGKPSNQFLSSFNAPTIDIGAAYTGKTLDLCAAGDTICEGVFGAGPTVAHALYPVNGQVSEGAAYAVSRI